MQKSLTMFKCKLRNHDSMLVWYLLCVQGTGVQISAGGRNSLLIFQVSVLYGHVYPMTIVPFWRPQTLLGGIGILYIGVVWVFAAGCWWRWIAVHTFGIPYTSTQKPYQ